MNNQSILRTDEFGSKRWYLNGELHREDGPAIEYVDGTKKWFFNGKYHRDDGPAAEYCNGDKSWYIKGRYFSNKTEWFQALTPEQQYNYLWNLNNE